MNEGADAAKPKSANEIEAAPSAPTVERNLGELRAAAVTGAKSYALSRLALEASNFASIVVLARLISPSATGHATVALVLPAMAVMLTFEGFGSALVQRTEISRAHLRTAMSLSVVTGAAAAALVAGLALTVGRSIFGARTADLILLVSPVFVLASFGTVSRGQLMRDLRFRTMSRRDSTLGVLGSALSVGLALCGLRASALIYPYLVATALDSAVMVHAAPPAGFGWSRPVARDLWSYGAAASLAALVTLVRRNIDYIILSATSSARMTGIYYRSFMFGAEYQSKVSSTVIAMLFPLLARSSSRDDLQKIRERSMQINAIVAMPLLGIVVVLAPELIPFLYGNHWRAAIVPTQILSAVGMIQILLAGADAVPMALGRTKLLLGVNLIFLLAYGSGIAVAVHFGLITVCCAAAGVYLLMLFLLNYLLVDRPLGLQPGRIFIDAWPALAGTLVSAAVAEIARTTLNGSVPEIIVLFVAGAASLAAYVLLLRFAFPNTWAWLARLARRSAGQAAV